MRALLEAGAPVAALTIDGHPPLHLTGSAEAAELLLAAGAPLDVQDSRGRTPLVFRLWEAGDPKQAEEARAASAAVAALMVSAAAGVGCTAGQRRQPGLLSNHCLKLAVCARTVLSLVTAPSLRRWSGAPTYSFQTTRCA